MMENHQGQDLKDGSYRIILHTRNSRFNEIDPDLETRHVPYLYYIYIHYSISFKHCRSDNFPKQQWSYQLSLRWLRVRTTSGPVELLRLLESEYFKDKRLAWSSKHMAQLTFFYKLFASVSVWSLQLFGLISRRKETSSLLPIECNDSLSS